MSQEDSGYGWEEIWDILDEASDEELIALGWEKLDDSV